MNDETTANDQPVSPDPDSATDQEASTGELGSAQSEVAPSAEAPASAPSPDEESSNAPPKRTAPSNPAMLRAWRTKRSVTGKVVGVIKGGYEVQVGRARGFCPHSQIDTQREDQPERHLGQVYSFRVIQARRGGEEVVVSRRALIEEEREESAKAVRATLIEGAVTQGRISSVVEFGAFVDLGAGVMGLVHLSEMAHGRVPRASDIVESGTTVRVKVLKVDAERGRISLSMRQAQEDPWSGIAERYLPGQVYPGAVARVVDFGVFVELAPGVEALAPASEMPPTAARWEEEFVPGAMRDWYVLRVEEAQRRISLTLPGLSPVADIAPGIELVGRVQRLERYGVFVWLAPGQVGLMPREFTGLDPRQDLISAFPIGQEVEVRVLEIEESRRRIRLARKGVSVERQDVATPRERASSRNRPDSRERPPRRDSAPSREAPASEPSSPFGTSLAEKLRDALGRGDSTSS